MIKASVIQHHEPFVLLADNAMFISYICCPAFLLGAYIHILPCLLSWQ